MNFYLNIVLVKPIPVFLYPGGGGGMTTPSTPGETKPTTDPPTTTEEPGEGGDGLRVTAVGDLARADRLKRKILTKQNETSETTMENDDGLNKNDEIVTTTDESIIQTTSFPSIGELPLEQHFLPTTLTPTKPVTPDTITISHNNYGNSHHHDINSISFTTSTSVSGPGYPNHNGQYPFRPSPTDQVFNFRPSYFQPTPNYQNFI